MSVTTGSRSMAALFDLGAASLFFLATYFVVPYLYRVASGWGIPNFPPEGTLDAVLIINIAMYMLATAAFIAIVATRHGSYFQLRLDIVPWLVLAPILVLALVIAELLLENGIPGTPLEGGKAPDATIVQIIMAGGAPSASGLFLVVILGPLAEEVFFRGILFIALRKYLPFLASAVISSLLFVAIHMRLVSSDLPIVLVGLSLRFLSSFTACFLLEKSGSLWPPITLHVIKNGLAAGFVVFPHIAMW